MAPDRDQPAILCRAGQGAGVGIAGGDRLLDEQMFAGLQGRQAIVAVQPGVAEQIDGIDVGVLQSLQAVAALSLEAEPPPRRFGAVPAQVADLDQIDPALVTQGRQRRQMDQRRGFAGADDEHADRRHCRQALWETGSRAGERVLCGGIQSIRPV